MKTTSFLAAALAGPLLLLAGCSASGAAPAMAPEATAAGGDYAQQDRNPLPGDGSGPQGAPADVPVTAGQKLARTARVGLTVTDVESAAIQLRQLAASMGGIVSAENLVTRVDPEGPARPVSTMVITVTADKLDSTLDQLKSVGTVTDRVIMSEDVTTQVADVDARVKTLEASIARLRELSGKAGSIRELTELEAELTNRISERDSLIAQQKVLAQRVAQSPITISLQLPPPAGQLESTGFLEGLVAGWNALLTSSRVLLTAVGAALPFVALAGLVATPFLVWRRRSRARTAAGGTAPSAATPAPRGEPGADE